MREGWKVEKLGDISNICYGYTAKASPESVGPKFLRITDIQNGTVNWQDVPTCPISKGDFDKHQLRAGDLVFARTGATTGKSYLIVDPPEAVAASYLIRMRVRKNGIDPAFVALFFQTASYWKAVAAGTSGSAQGGFNASKLAELRLPLPPLPEQKRIVAKLDEAFTGIETAIANTEKNLGNARELFESYLNSIFTLRGEGWTELPLSEICSIKSSLVDPREPEFSDLPHVGAGNMISKNGELINVQTAREEGLKSGKFLFDESMVLYSKIRPYLEKIARPSFKGLCSADVYPLSTKTEFLRRDFLYYMLLSKDFTDYAIAGSARAGMPKVNRDHLFQYRAALPNVDEQQRFVSSLDDVATESARLQSIYQQKLTALAELKQSLLQKAFSGELTAEKKSPRERLKGTIIEYEAPTEPVGAEDWEAMRR